MAYKITKEVIDSIERFINNRHKAEVCLENREIVVIDVHRKRIWPPKENACNNQKLGM